MPCARASPQVIRPFPSSSYRASGSRPAPWSAAGREAGPTAHSPITSAVDEHPASTRSNAAASRRGGEGIASTAVCAALSAHSFDRVCAQQGVEQRLARPNQLWTNGQVERINRTIKEATVKRYPYDSRDRFRSHLNDFLNAYNFARRLKALNGSTPYQYLCNLYDSEENHRFHLNPSLHFAGPNT